MQAAAPLYEPMEYHLAVTSLLSGKSPGQIYVDNPVNPSVAWANIGQRNYLAGSPKIHAFNEAISVHLEEAIIPQATEAGQQALTMIYPPELWKDQIDKMMSERRAVHAIRHRYTIRSDGLANKFMLLTGYELAEVDGELLKKKCLGNIDTLIEEVLSEAPSIDHFLKHCFGFCTVKDDELVGWCLSEYNVKQRCEVGIETLENHRNLGIATAMTTALIEEAALRGYSQVGWHCYASNLASIATALKVGFKKSHEYPASYFHFNQALNLAMHGDQHYLRGDFEGALFWYVAACKTEGAPNWLFWNTACVQAKLDNPNKAFQNIERAVEAGLTDIDYIKNSEQFTRFNDLPEWKQLIQKLENRSD